MPDTDAPMFGADFREQLRKAVLAAGTTGPRASEIVDLACHASESAVLTLRDTCLRGSDTGIKLSAFEIACQIAGQMLTAAFENTHAFAESLGLRQAETTIEVSR